MAEILTQSEIDSLLYVLSSGDVDVEEMKKETEKKRVKVYDFRLPDKFSKEQMRTLQMIHENLARLLTSILSPQIRSLVDFEVASIEQLSYEEFIMSLPEPTIIGICDLEPLKGQFLLEINSDIGFAIIDRLLGGAGSSLQENRAFTDIEEEILKKVINWLINGFPEAWKNIIEVKPRLRTIESNLQFAQIVPSNDMTILITLAAKIANSEGLLNICLPYIMIEDILPKLNAQQWFSTSSTGQTSQQIESLKSRIKKASLDIAAELGGTELTVTDLLYLQKGDVIKLANRVDDKVKIKVGNKLKYKGIVGISRQKQAIKITDIVEEGEEGEENE